MSATNLRIILQDIADRFLIALDSTFDSLYYGLDHDLWEKTYHNPIKFLKLYKKKIINFDSYDFDVAYLVERYNNLIKTKAAPQSKKIAYISPEFGFHESFPNYAGGLGVLAGDVIKTAATNNIDMIGVGLLYSEGYFRQSFVDNKQKERYKKINLRYLPINELRDKSGKPVVVTLKLPNIDLYVKAYSLKILNNYVILLSTDLPENGKFKIITDKLYVGDRYLRLLQEIILGFGSIRVLEAAGINVDVFHINEGHAAFALWERASIFASKNKIDIDKSLDFLRSTNVFTTHTPVVHGNEEFKLAKLKNSLSELLVDFGTNYPKLVKLGQTTSTKPDEFSMTVLGINLSGISNGVSRLHATTATKMWKDIYVTNSKIQPFTYVTNGVHTHTWMSSLVRQMLSDDSEVTDVVVDVERYNPELIMKAKMTMKRNLFQGLIKLNLNDNSEFFKHNNQEKFENSLIICFARRFALYKRPSLFVEIISKILAEKRDKNLNIIFLISGKAHPKDVDGKSEIQKVCSSISELNINDSVLFIPDYDINIGRILVQGSDIWLNNPIKPLEACGTSGMKAGLNFGVNLSIDDGWWDEAYNGKNGYSIDGINNNSIIIDDFIGIISNDIIPKFLNAQSNSSFEWVDIMKQSFLTSFIQFSSERMLNDYLKILYKS